ncbi:4-alpha-glucanotransferase [Achromobacter sp. UMC46]|uniref:4-alpha-glucanotransferase n=1 Tax=Achromobacter sp. UMC46 TaxID=1862319 RepID=UPI0016009053|nr:4-alpha-glucanotransferase [Achromobacter sp. UMC46]MBB1593235.1 4-alpha-glucanotransferase [Achromobacter sp. UMC46]
MNAPAQSALSALAADAGIVEDWTGADHRPRRVSTDTLRALLDAMDLPAGTDAEIRDSQQRLSAASAQHRLPPMLIALPGETVPLPADCAGACHMQTPSQPPIAVRTATGADGAPTLRAPATPGYYALDTPGGSATLAVAPPRAPTLDDLLGVKDARAWGLAVQLYSLRRPSTDLARATHGFGDFGALRDLASAAGSAGADALAISPVHAMFAADPAHCSPYSPSSRLFLNTLYADPAGVLGHAAVHDALAGMDHAQLRALDARPLIDWPAAATARLALLRRLHARFPAAASAAQRQAYDDYRNAAGQDLRDHALFEALHADRARMQGAPVPWTDWPADLRDPRSPATERYADAHADDVGAHMFGQWLASASLARAQQAARDAGMRVGLLADLAVGGSPAGSHAWSRQADLMSRASVGAPPDLHNPLGQGWGLTALSPTALRQSGYSAFLAMLRASLAQAGGVRIDHILGMARMWLIPDGAPPQDGAYLRYPLTQLLRLTALEAWLHRALVIGENLGTVPDGFDAQLQGHGLLGMDVLWFMRADEPAADAPGPAPDRAPDAAGPAEFLAPADWPSHAVAMTTTHDLPTLEGWWHAQDILWRSRLGLLGPDQNEAALRAARLEDRAALWRTVQASSPAASTLTLPREPPGAELLGFVAATPCPLMLVTLEDLTGQLDQPNLPGTVAGHPNWRQRVPLSVADCLNAPTSVARLQPVRATRGQP